MGLLMAQLSMRFSDNEEDIYISLEVSGDGTVSHFLDTFYAFLTANEFADEEILALHDQLMAKRGIVIDEEC